MRRGVHSGMDMVPFAGRTQVRTFRGGCDPPRRVLERVLLSGEPSPLRCRFEELARFLRGEWRFWAGMWQRLPDCCSRPVCPSALSGLYLIFPQASWLSICRDISWLVDSWGDEMSMAKCNGLIFLPERQWQAADNSSRATDQIFQSSILRS